MTHAFFLKLLCIRRLIRSILVLEVAHTCAEHCDAALV